MHIRFAGITAADERESDLQVAELDLGGFSVRSADHERMANHGSTVGRDYVTANMIRFVLRTHTESYSEGLSVLNEFLNAWRSVQYEQNGGLQLLEFRHGHIGVGEPWGAVYGVPDSSTNIVLDESTHRGFASAAFEFRQVDPLFYGALRTVTVQNTNTVLVETRAPTPPIVRFNGPYENPKFVIDGQEIVTRDLSGTSSEWLEVDPSALRVIDRWGDETPGKLSRLTHLSRLAMGPGNHRVTLENAASAQLSWRPAFYSVLEA